MKTQFISIYEKLQKLKFIAAIKNGLVMMIPILLIGSFSLVLISIPFDLNDGFCRAYQSTFFYSAANIIYNATFGLLSLYLTATIAISYARLDPANSPYSYSALLTSLICFCITAGFSPDSLDSLAVFEAKSIFSAMVSACVASSLYFFFLNNKRFKKKLFADGADHNFTLSLQNLFPITITVLLFALFSQLISFVFHVNSFHELFTSLINAFFANSGPSFATGFFYVLISSLLWFFGIHGSNVLDGVSNYLFVPALAQNAQAAASHLAPSEILTKPFFDAFVLFGGSGSGLCLMLALLLFSKRKSSLSVARFSIFPMLFNVNEVMLFGLPVILNPYFLIPFISAPLLCYSLSYLALSIGLVPMTTTSISWVTPVFISGYISTGAVSAIFLQLANIVLGTLLYIPFVRMYDQQKEREAFTALDKLTTRFQESESFGLPIMLTALNDACGAVARTLVYDLKQALKEKSICIYYQPQYDNLGHCIGGEALLRYKHPVFGMLYPPLVIKIAEEAEIKDDLEKFVIRKALEDADTINKSTGQNHKISINLTAQTICRPDFITFLDECAKDSQVKQNHIFLEITEQEAFLTTSGEEATYFSHLRQLGYHFALDDFSMGHTSLKYLQKNKFDVVKLDGSLVTNLLTNSRCEDIIASIIYLSQSMDFNVCAEYVETREQQKRLEELGCSCYQGYLYSPAVPLEDYISLTSSTR